MEFKEFRQKLDEIDFKILELLKNQLYRYETSGGCLKSFEDIDKQILNLQKEKFRIYEEYEKTEEWKKHRRPAGWC